VNDLFVALGIESWKPLLSTLFAPPIPMIALILIGSRLIGRRPRTGHTFVAVGCVTLWLSMTPATGVFLAHHLLHLPPPLAAIDIEGLRDRPETAIVVLGRGRRAFAEEYGEPALTPGSLERLQYGIWLSRATRLPLAFSGGVGWRAEPGAAEADVAARIAERDFDEKLQWVENASRDTHENAVKTLALLQPLGIRRIVLVTNQTDMPRAVRNFAHAAPAGVEVIPAPMDVPSPDPAPFMRWLPSPDGYQSVCIAIHEWLGLLAGA
jgi:uncharacterized SAM-binding protein YcdF (DUF218 family)